jgi:hypothetical protein
VYVIENCDSGNSRRWAIFDRRMARRTIAGMALFGRGSERNARRAEAHGRWLRQRHPLAIASLVLGVVSLIEFGVLLIFGLAGIVLGIVALVQLRRRGGGSAGAPAMRGHGLAISGIVLSVVSLVIAAVIYRLPAGGGG